MSTTRNSLLIRNGRVIDPLAHSEAITNICIENGKIISVGALPKEFIPEQIIDASHCIVCPGFIDLSMHLPEPGLEQKGTIASETHAAASSGITFACCTPDVDPVIDSPAVVNLIRDQAHAAGYCEVGVIGALTRELAGERLSDLYALKTAGVVAVSNLRRPIHSNQILHTALKYAATHDLLVMLHPDDASLNYGGCLHEGKLSAYLGLAGIPAIAETTALARDLILVEDTGARVHFSQLSTAESMEMIAEAKIRGLPVTADVAISQLLLTEDDIKPFDTNYHLIPPLRTKRDRDALLTGVKSGVIDSICSHHQPHEWAAKHTPFALSEPGMSSVELLLPLVLRLVQQGKFDLITAIERLSTSPAKAIQKACGLTQGMPANLCVIDPNYSWQLTEQRLLSFGKNSPFLSEGFQGQVLHTICNGKIVFSRN